ncbi:hypothetical protein TTHERM_00467250 (macronuclear) [Tetrahymena thermophila SB210]|uniref:Dynein heavy chain AAA 5 extension domain-containing protein n=1 Tax=Tetrahymena thermophila (strain SB210) TaxID=312017 RepID=I7M426_TETTS|nr:hypothetical protein TTHERM_00467250 [Tetrahymena thermophila SB210]EAS04776.2 hypothetical protein TTHERM_00467250 [Tetrahymena thermophila SB210]|eukprot:XP_001025021.2 hypothetical protein TTHERM_00467250 [Tetrahymena thermophila SB210]
MKENELSLIKSGINNMYQTDQLILQCYDSYYLPDFQDNKSYFVVELEFCDLPLVSFKKQHSDFFDQIINQLISTFQSYFQGKYTIEIDQYDLRLGDLEFFIKILSENQICVKLNLLSLKSYVQKYQAYEENSKTKQIIIETQNMENEIKISEDQIQNFLNLISKEIQKQDLVKEIKESYSYLLEKYSIDIFENISQHPQYQSYQVKADIDGCLNLTAIYKQDKQIPQILGCSSKLAQSPSQQRVPLIIEESKMSSTPQVENVQGVTVNLQIYKIKTFQEALLLQNKLDRCALSKSCSTFNINSVNVIPCQNECYVLVEKSKIQNIQNCISIQEININEKIISIFNSFNAENEKLKKAFIFLQNLINLSQDLLIEKNVQITKINPSNILVDKQDVSNSKVFQYTIDQCIFFEDFELAYQNKVKQVYEVLKIKFIAADKFNKMTRREYISSDKYIESYIEPFSQILSYNLIYEYFRAISQNSTEKVCSLYLLIQQCLKVLELVIFSSQHYNLKVVDEQKNSIQLIIDSNNILSFKKLNKILNHNQYHSKEFEMEICEDDLINELIIIGQQLKFTVITMEIIADWDLDFLSLDIFKTQEFDNMSIIHKDINDIFAEAINQGTQEGVLKQSEDNKIKFHQIWKILLKWCKIQVEFQRQINLGDSFLIQPLHLNQQQSLNYSTNIILILKNSFMNQQGLRTQFLFNESAFQNCKINLQSISTNAKVDLQFCDLVINLTHKQIEKNIQQNEFIELDLDELGYIKLYQKMVYYQKIQQESNILRKVVTVKQIANPANRSISPKTLPLLDIKKEIYSKQVTQNGDSSQILYFNNQNLQLKKSNSQNNLKKIEQQQQQLQNSNNIKVVKVIKRDSIKSDFSKLNRSQSPKQELIQDSNKLTQQNINIQMNKNNSQRSIKIQNGSPVFRNKGNNKDNNLFSLDYSQILNQSQQLLVDEGENTSQDNSKLPNSPSNKILNTSDLQRSKNMIKLNISGGAQFRLRSTSPLQRQFQDKKFCSNVLQQQHDNSFSALAKDGVTLVKGTFVRHAQDQKNKETLLTNQLNTLGALQFFVQTMLPPSHRIGTFYSMHCLYLYLDTHSFNIATMKKNDEEIENNLKFKEIRNQLRKEEATFQDEYEFFKNNMIQKELEMKIRKKIINMKKYQQVMIEQVPKEILAPFSTQLMNNILNLINLNENNEYIIKYFAKLTEDLFAEVTINYYHSLQKSILDYMLLSDEIAVKLNLTEGINIPKPYGENGIENIYLSKSSQYFIEQQGYQAIISDQKRQLISKIVFYNPATIEIFNLFLRCEKQNKFKIIDVADLDSKLFSIKEFTDLYQKGLQQFSRFLSQELNACLIDIYSKVIHGDSKNLLDENRDNFEENFINTFTNQFQQQFYTSSALLIQTLLQQKIYENLEDYKRLFKKFDKAHIREAEEIIFMQDDEDILQQHYEKRFLKINLRFDEEKDELQFDTTLPKIKEEILNYLNSILKCVQQIERPEYTIFKSLDIFNEYSQFFEKQKQYINIIDQDSEIFKNVYSYIERIIDSNFVEVAKILKIQKMYCQIFNHKKMIIKKIEIDNVKLEKKDITREYIRKRIKKIQVYSEQIQEDFSPFIRMNMIEVQCYQMRQTLLKECFNLQMIILKDAKEYFLQKVNKVQQKVLDVIEEIKKPIEPSNYQHLINLEKKIHEIKIFEYNEIVLQQQELKKWIFYLLDYPYSQLSQNEFNKFYHLTKLIFSIIIIAEKEEVRVKNERILVEKELQKEVRMLEGQTAKIRQQLSELILKGDNSQSMQVIQEITEVKKQIFKANDWKQQIQKNQLLVGFDVTPMEQIDTFIQQIIAFERLWNLQALWEKNQVLWIKDTPMFKLDIKDIQNKIKYMKEEIDYLNNFPFEKLFQQVLQDPSIQKLLLSKQNQNQNIQNKGNQQKFEGPVKILKNIEKDLSLFEFHFEQLSYITHPALKQEDQEEIQNIVQVNLYKDRDHIALKRVIDTNVRKYLPEIDRILSRKLELFNIESTLERIIKDWSSTKIQFVFDENGLEYIEQQQLLQIVQKAQEHQVELFLVESYEKKEFEDKIHQLQDKMKSAEILGTLLMKVQDLWKRYFMFFDQNPDNQKKMPLEASYYSGIDKMWKIMNKFMKKVPSIYQFVAEVQFIEQLKKFDFIFNNIEFGVQRYINSVRSQCGKLFYVSDEQIFELVQEPKNIEKITEIVCNIFDNFDQLIILDGISFLSYKRQIQAEKLVSKKNISKFDNQKKKQKGILKNAQKIISKQDSNIQIADQSSKNIQSHSIINGEDADQENVDKDLLMEQDLKKVTMESQENVLLDEDDIEREELIKTIREQEIEEIRKQKFEEEKREEEYYSQQKEQRYLIGVVGINNNSILFNLHLDINLLYGNSYEILNFIQTQSQIKMQQEIHQVIQFRLSQDTNEITDFFLKTIFNDFIFSATQVAEDYYFWNKISFLSINQQKNGENITQSIGDILKYYIGYQKAICNYERNNSKIKLMKEVKILQLIYYIEWLQRESKNKDFSSSLESFDSIKRFKYNLNERTGILTLQILNKVFQYGYNYFSPTKRIFRNPQSDKVFVFLCQNLLDFKFSILTHNRYKKDGKRSIIQESSIMFGNLVFELHVQRIFSLNYFQNILQGICACGDWLYLDGFEEMSNQYWSFLRTFSDNLIRNRILNNDIIQFGLHNIKCTYSNQIICSYDKKSKFQTLELDNQVKEKFRILDIQKQDVFQIINALVQSIDIPKSEILGQILSKIIFCISKYIKVQKISFTNLCSVTAIITQFRLSVDKLDQKLKNHKKIYFQNCLQCIKESVQSFYLSQLEEESKILILKILKNAINPYKKNITNLQIFELTKHINNEKAEDKIENVQKNLRDIQDESLIKKAIIIIFRQIGYQNPNFYLIEKCVSVIQNIMQNKGVLLSGLKVNYKNLVIKIVMIYFEVYAYPTYLKNEDYQNIFINAQPKYLMFGFNDPQRVQSQPGTFFRIIQEILKKNKKQNNENTFVKDLKRKIQKRTSLEVKQIIKQQAKYQQEQYARGEKLIDLDDYDEQQSSDSESNMTTSYQVYKAKQKEYQSSSSEEEESDDESDKNSKNLFDIRNKKRQLQKKQLQLQKSNNTEQSNQSSSSNSSQSEEQDISSVSQTPSESSESDQSAQSKTDSENESLENSNVDSILSSQKIEDNLEASINSYSSYNSKVIKMQKQQTIKCNQIYSEKDYSQKRQKKVIKRIVLIDAVLDQQLCTMFKTPEKIVQESKQQVNLIKNNIFLVISCENLSRIDVDMINNYGLVNVDQSWDVCFQYEHSYFKSSQIPQFFENYDVELIDFLFNQIFQPLVKWICSYSGESSQENQMRQISSKFKTKFDDFKFNTTKKSIFLTNENQFSNNKKNSITSPLFQNKQKVYSDYNISESQNTNFYINSKKIIDTVSESSIRNSKIEESLQSALNQSKQNEEQALLIQNRGILIFQISDKEMYFCLTRVFSLFLKPLQDEQIYNHRIFQNNMKNRSILIIQMFVFSLVSSVGQLIQIEHRKLFDQYLKDILLKDVVQFNKLVNNITLPQEATLFDFYLDTFLYKLVKQKNKQNESSKFQFIFNSQKPKKDDSQIDVFPLYEWKSYSESASQDILDKSNTVKLQSKGVNIDIQKLFFGNTIIIPTPQLVKTISMLNLLISNKIDVLIACSQNCYGRTTYLKQFVLSKKLDFNNSMKKHKEETMLKYTQLSANRRSILDQADTLSYYPMMKGEQEKLLDRITGEECQLKQQGIFYRINTVTNYSVFMKFLTGNLKLTENSTYVPPQLCDQLIIVIDDINFSPLQSDNNPPSPSAPILETIRQIKYKQQFYTIPNDINYNVQFINQVKNINFLLSFNPNHPYQIQRSLTKSFHVYGIDQLNEENLETIYLKTIKDKLLDCYQQYLVQIEHQQKNLHGITERTIQGISTMINSYSLKIVRATLQYHKKCCELFPKLYNQQQLCHIFQSIMGLLQQSYIIDKKSLAQITIYLNWIEYSQLLQKQSEFTEKINNLFNQISQIAGSQFSYNLKEFFTEIQMAQSQINTQKQNAIVNQENNQNSSKQLNRQTLNLGIEEENVKSEQQNEFSSDKFLEGFIFKNSIQSIDSEEQNFEPFIQQSGKQGETQINEFEKQIIWTTDIVQNQQSIFPYYFRKQTFFQTIKDQIENYNQQNTLKIQKIITSQFIYSLIRINHILINSKQNILIYSQPFSNRKKILSLICFINKIQFKYIKTDHISDLIQITNKLKKYLRQTAITDERYLVHIDDTPYTSKQIYDAISQIISCHSFENFFSSEEIRSISQQMKKANEKLKKFSDFEMQELMYYKMVQNIQYSISFQHTDIKQKQQNEEIYPFFKDQFQQLFLPQMTVNQLLEYTQQYIESFDNLIVSQSSQLYPLLNSIFTSMIQISAMKDIISNYKIFQSYLQILNSIFLQRSIYLQKKLDKMSEICQKIKVIIKSQKIIQRRLQDMIPSIEKEQASIDLISNKIDESQTLIDQIKQEYDQKNQVLQEKIKVSNQIQEEINIKILHSKQNLENIEKQVINTDKNELYILKQMKLPSNTMKLILQGLCFLIYPNPLEKRKNQQNGQIEIDWWAASVKILNNPKFLEDLVHLDKQTVGKDQINKVEALFEDNQKFINSKVIENQQKGLKVIFQWMTSFIDYRKLEIELEPLKNEYDNALNEQDILNLECQEIASKLEIEQGSLSILKNTQNDLINRKKEIQQKFDVLSQKEQILNTFINEAMQFFNILDIEKIELEQMQKNLLRDCCYSAIILNYFGRFNNSDRKDFKLHLRSSVNEFSQLEDEDLHNLLKFQFEEKQIEIDNLFLQNFNFDTFFIENYFIITNSVCLWTFSYDPLNILDQLKQILKIDLECQHQDQKILQEHLQEYSSQKVKILVKNVDTNFEKKYYNLIKKIYDSENDEFNCINFDKKQLKINKQFELYFQTKNEDFFLQNKYNNYNFNLIDFSQRLNLDNQIYKQSMQKKLEKSYQIEDIKKNIYNYIENSSVENETRLFADDFLKLVVDYFQKYKEIKQLNQ